MIERLLLFGATGDLAGRFLLSALAELHDEASFPTASVSLVPPVRTGTTRRFGATRPDAR
jgi:glucose-6-phosphate 1-dehydrogenase